MIGDSGQDGYQTVTRQARMTEKVRTVNMRNDDSKLSMWVVLAAVACCGIPLLLLISGGSILAFIGGVSTGSNLLIVLSLIFLFVLIWLILRKNKL